MNFQDFIKQMQNFNAKEIVLEKLRTGEMSQAEFERLKKIANEMRCKNG